jgi:hypothetical protein
MKLTKNFTLQEMTFSQTAERKGIINAPTEKEIESLKRLCEDILQPLRDKIGGVNISSGFRSVKLNKKIGGSKSSQHCKGEAADLTSNEFNVYEICAAIINLKLPFHQLIEEFGSWVHVSIAPKGQKPRGQFLRASKERNKFGRLKTVYTEIRY